VDHSTPVRRGSIDGVRVRGLVSHADQRGSLTELLRSDWPEFERFGQAILTVNGPGIIRGWHWHDRQTDVIVVVSGHVLLPLFDGRPWSQTYRTLEEHVADGSQLFALFVPPGVYHGYKTLGRESALIVNFPDRTYDPAAPDENRLPHDDASIGYDWQPQA
jgi:dTDP-4-dehydrorhamnose 3,5-epimerase